MVTANTVPLTTTTLKTKVQQYYNQDQSHNPMEYSEVRNILKILIDLGLITGVTANDVDAVHKALGSPTKVSG